MLVVKLATVTVALALAFALPASAQRGVDKENARTKAPVIAIFPFKVLNKEPTLAHLGEGAAEAVINKVVNDKALRIVEESQLDKAVNSLARNQTGLFEEESYLAVGQMVDARFIVIGSVQVVENQVAVTARLLEVETRQLLTSERSTKAMADVFGAYEEVAAKLLSKVTFHLAQRIGGGESADDLAVRQLIEEGKLYDPEFARAAGITKDLARAMALYDKAALRDPRSARAQLALGHAQTRRASELARRDVTSSKRLLQSGRNHLARATELDPGNTFAWNELGRTEGRLGNHRAAQAAFQKALDLDGAFVAARYGLARALFHQGDLEGARAQALQARQSGDVRAGELLREIDTSLAMKKEKPNPAAQR